MNKNNLTVNALDPLFFKAQVMEFCGRGLVQKILSNLLSVI